MQLFIDFLPYVIPLIIMAAGTRHFVKAVRACPWRLLNITLIVALVARGKWRHSVP
ncbi:MAG: hypothetical protein H0W86_08450 [Armatimonadetes bacterium]|nr:hypothetical protein [Armatimonadota bacterium]